MGCLSLTSQRRRLLPVLLRHRLPEQAAIAEESGVGALGERAECGLRLRLAAGQAPGLGGE